MSAGVLIDYLTTRIRFIFGSPIDAMKALAWKTSKYWPDSFYLKKMYRRIFKRNLDFNNVQTYNEKLNWLKLHNRQPIFTTMVDKYEVKEYVKNIIGEGHTIPTLGIYDKFEDIDFEKLPEKFVLKTTHDSGSAVICKDKSKFDYAYAKKKLTSSLANNYYYHYREWPYKNVKPRIIAEEYMEDLTGELRDYKFFCFDGKAKFMFIASNRFSGDGEVCFDFFDMDFNHIPVKNEHPNSKSPIPKPALFEEMARYAERLSEGIKHVRVDLYEIKGKIYFGEYTFYHFAAVTPFEPDEWDYEFGKFIDLSNIR